MAKYQNEHTGVIANLSKPMKGWKLISKSTPSKERKLPDVVKWPEAEEGTPKKKQKKKK